MADLCALLRRRHLPQTCRECGESPRCMCVRTQQTEDRQSALDRALQYETDLAFAEARAAGWRLRRRGE